MKNQSLLRVGQIGSQMIGVGMRTVSIFKQLVLDMWLPWMTLTATHTGSPMSVRLKNAVLVSAIDLRCFWENPSTLAVYLTLSSKHFGTSDGNRPNQLGKTSKALLTQSARLGQMYCRSIHCGFSCNLKKQSSHCSTCCYLFVALLQNSLSVVGLTW